MTFDPLRNDRKACVKAAMRRQGRCCFWCHNYIAFSDDPWADKSSTASADHVIPQWLGGQTTQENIVAACKACNEDRGQMHNRSWFIIDATGFNEWLKRERARPRRRTLSVERLTMNLRPLLEEALGR